ncbi:lactate utilization protein B [Sinomicrobium weinanense]|uniref:Lactate utilization protein n=1 Tax=Sinomicrobium weinanense TaxID=2842200 RepID=A0A926Q406_9FLAO|nr:lactate utilization protein B [Sinomicrobium weinanense]MBC9798113.1 lactate utilization protein [Sinomicrobium weinanense]MBU3122993.1 lactate utilization protein [Sinomicrobium weinanense]
MKGTHANLSKEFITTSDKTDWHNDALWFLRAKRDKQRDTIEDWEKLRSTAAAIKDHTLSRLADYLQTFEENALQNGMQVHWAWDDAELREITASILRENNARSVVKSKSMLTEECGLNPYLEKEGFDVVDTDLGERIVQLRKEHPSHIVVPAIHLKKEEVSDTFHEKMQTEKGNADPGYLTAAAREALRKDFIKADAAITGVNFGVAESGAVVVCTNEGNADMGVHSKKTVIHCMGLEKLVPGYKELAVFTRLLARSATGQPVTVFTSHYRKPRPDVKQHIIIVNNKRTDIYTDPEFRQAMRCIRCGACMNTCPVYRRSGGHSYHHTVPGPIGSVLAPFYGKEKNKDLPFASTLCGSCNNVCPVKIDLAGLLYKWRQKLTDETSADTSKKMSMQVGSSILKSHKKYGMVTTAFRWVPKSLLQSKFNPWNSKGEDGKKARVFPEVPGETFRQWYKKRQK